MLTDAKIRKLEIKAQIFGMKINQFTDRWLFAPPNPQGFAFTAPVSCREIVNCMADFYCHADLSRPDVLKWFTDANEVLDDVIYITIRCATYNQCSSDMLFLRINDVILGTFEYRLKQMKGGKEIHRRYWFV